MKLLITSTSSLSITPTTKVEDVLNFTKAEIQTSLRVNHVNISGNKPTLAQGFVNTLNDRGPNHWHLSFNRCFPLNKYYIHRHICKKKKSEIKFTLKKKKKRSSRTNGRNIETGSLSSMYSTGRAAFIITLVFG